MKNRLANLTDHLFAQVERLGDENLTADQLDIEVTRAKALADVSGRILDAGKLQLDAAKLVHASTVENTNVALPGLLDSPPSLPAPRDRNGTAPGR